VPGWHEKTKELQKNGKIQVVGLIQEQHADRCSLFQAWHGMEWPVLVDSLNLLGVRAVPLTFLIDEHGVIRKSRAKSKDLEHFLETKYPTPDFVARPTVAPNLVQLHGQAKQSNAADDWRAYGDALFLSGQDKNLDDCIDAYRSALKASKDAKAHFRLGVALRRRYESSRARENDFRDALTEWGRALAIVPGQYIWRRRIEQYGPRLAKPYSFYDWVNQARRDLTARGATIPPLRVEPSGAEFAHPSKRFAAEAAERTEPDPSDELPLDEKPLIRAQIAVAPATLRPGSTARVHVHLTPNSKRKAHWNNEAGRTPGETVLWLRPPAGVEVDRRRRAVSATTSDGAVSDERRELEFEVKLSKSAKVSNGRVRIPAYVTYYVCEDTDGVCFYFRQNLEIELAVSSRD